MHRIILAALCRLALASAGAASTTHCTTREDPAFQRWVTECTDGGRAITRWDAGLQCYSTDITKAPQGDQPPARQGRGGRSQRR
jgi:hypothetical protein